MSGEEQPGGRVSGKPVALLLAAVLVGAALFKWWPSDERAVRRQLDALADTITVPSTDTEFSRVTRLTELRNIFSPDARFHFDDRGDGQLSRDEVMALAERWSPPPGGVFVSFPDPRVEIAAGRAAVALTAKMSRRDGQTGETHVELRPASLEMAKGENGWLITSVDVGPARPEEPAPPPDR